MSVRAQSAFTVDRRESTPAPWEGGQLSRTRFEKTFTGALEGTSVVEALMAGSEGGPMVYVAIERIEGVLDGRKGSFLLMHQASHHASGDVSGWTIVPGSGTGELAGLRGTAEITQAHELVLEYDLG